MRFILMFNDMTISRAYRLSQYYAIRLVVDGRKNQAYKDDTFYGKAIAKFNDPSWIPVSEALPNLHPDFEEPKEYPLRPGALLDEEKAKNILGGHKLRIKEMLDKYDRSGRGAINAADMYTLGDKDNDDDSDTLDDRGEEDPGTEVDEGRGSIEGGTGVVYTDPTIRAKFGHFDLEKAMRSGGDDRKDYLGKNPTDILYWWHVLDELELITMMCVKLNQDLRADCYTPLQSVSDLSSSSKKKRAINDDNEEIKQNLGMLMDNIATITAQLTTFTSKVIEAAEKKNALAVEVADREHARLLEESRLRELNNLEDRLLKKKSEYQQLLQDNFREKDKDARAMQKAIINMIKQDMEEIESKKRKLEKK
ncbi:hypothetical protein FisN_8Lu068 [Fistulifera solaris]|uniref:Uncharacterized protein n=1 Tax=Fistulifera solaris TaxID=1519565 RepID=A0A1Z5JD84_FISSO|nr:hypothetical protein FisN_8Lu068 [Fistulifera solaris]|eukprot:GAX11970.1 hypothetical protein FisN_8Lu068 [Fistulifera solaris]